MKRVVAVTEEINLYIYAVFGPIGHQSGLEGSLNRPDEAA